MGGIKPKKKKQLKGFHRVSNHKTKPKAKELAKAVRKDGRKYRIIPEWKGFTVFAKNKRDKKSKWR